MLGRKPRSRLNRQGDGPETSTKDRDKDKEIYSVGQALVSVLNNPAQQESQFRFLGFTGDSWDLHPPPLAPGLLPDVQLDDFQQYFASTSKEFRRFEHAKKSALQTQQRTSELLPGASKPVQGEGLIQAMRQVPAMFFHEEFSLTRPEVWSQVCPKDSDEDRASALEELMQFLDIVETYLLREISARSDHFLEAAAAVQELRSTVQKTYETVKDLRGEVQSMDEGVLEASVTIKKLQRQRQNLEAVLNKAKVMETVAQGQMALELMLPRDSSATADFAGALDVLDVLKSTVESGELEGLHALRSLPEHIAEMTAVVDELMASDFLERTRMHSLDALVARLTTWNRSNSGKMRLFRVTSEADEPTVGLLRDSRDEEEVRGADSLLQPQLEGVSNREEIQEILLPLVIGMHRTCRLGSAMKDMQESATAQLKDAYKDVVQRVMAMNEGDGASQGDGLHSLSDTAFVDLLTCLHQLTAHCLLHYHHCCSLIKSIIPLTAPVQRTTLNALTSQCSDVLQGIADAAQARWSKLISSRPSVAGGTVGVLRQLAYLCDAFSAMIESYGLRVGVSLRNAVQMHSKSHMDSMHSKGLSNLAGSLEQERWVAIKVPPDVQDMANQLLQLARGWTHDDIEPHDSEEIHENGHHSTTSTPKSGGAQKPPNHPQGQTNGTAKPAPASAFRLNTASAPSFDPSPTHAASPGPLAPPPPPFPSAASEEIPERSALSDTSLAPPPSAVDATVSQETLHGTGSSARSPSGDGLMLGDRSFPVVHAACTLVRLLQQYADLQAVAPSCTADLARRVVELLKVFNSRACQLVLGAGAMQSSGLKSITAKHLALSCQCLDALMALHPALVTIFTAPVQQPRRALLLPEFDRVFQDLKVHRDEILGKLVTIMKERLQAVVKTLPSVAEQWSNSRHTGVDGMPDASQFAQSIGKQLTVLKGVLSPLLQQEELYYVFGRVGGIYSKILADAYDSLEPRGVSWQNQCRADLEYYIDCFHNIPIEPNKVESKLLRIMHVYYSNFQAMLRQRSSGDAGGPAAVKRTLSRQISVDSSSGSKSSAHSRHPSQEQIPTPHNPLADMQSPVPTTSSGSNPAD